MTASKSKCQGKSRNRKSAISVVHQLIQMSLGMWGSLDTRKTNLTSEFKNIEKFCLSAIIKPTILDKVLFF